MNEKLRDINEVCKMLGITSRTLRFYEEKGIISSTKDRFSTRRKYTHAQVEHIKNVMILRSLSLTIKTISELQKNGTDLKNAVLARRAEIYASIEAKTREINLLNEALATIDSGIDIFENKSSTATIDYNDDITKIAKISASAIIEGDFAKLKKYFSEKMLEYSPESVFDSVRRDTLQPLGSFVSIEKTAIDDVHKNIIYQYIRYENLGLKIKFVFHNKQINGLWMNYYEI